MVFKFEKVLCFKYFFANFLKKTILLSAICLISSILIAQSNNQKIETKPFGTLKFYPLGLVTNTLQLGTEQFNKANNRSTVAILGLRYRKSQRENSSFSTNIDGFNNWKGATLLLERRIYVPKFKFRPHLEKPDQLFGSGVYVAPFIKLDYSINDIDITEYKNTLEGGVNKSQLVQTTGKINYFGGIGGLNLGYQLTLFQYLYLDAYLGGGLRLLNKNDKTKEKVLSNSNGYIGSFYDSGAIETFVVREGVVPNAGISIGIKW